MKKERILSKYSNVETTNGTRRFFSVLIDALLLILVMVLTSIGSHEILSNVSSYKSKMDHIEEERIALYKIEEEAKIYRFKNNEDQKYLEFMPLEDLFAEYALSHILLSYQTFPSVFETYHIEVKNSLNVEVASYETDQLAYFYTQYVPKYNDYNNKTNDILDFKGDDPKLYFIKQLKEKSPKSEYWHIEENSLNLPVLKGEFAVDLYRYLFNEESEYQTGLTNYNYLAKGFQNIWSQQAEQLTQSTRFKEHYDVYKDYYASCSYTLDGVETLTYLVSFFLVMILPALFIKRQETIGKALMKVSVIGCDGYELTPAMRILRKVLEFFLFAPIIAISSYFSGGLNNGLYYPLFTIGRLGISYIHIVLIFGVIGLINLVMSGIKKDRRTITDLLTNARVIDLRLYSEPQVKEEEVVDVDELEKLRIENNTNDKSQYFDSSNFNNSERK